MSHALLFSIAFAMVASSQPVSAQGHVIMTPQLAEATRKFTTFAPYPEYPASAVARHLEGSGWFMLHVRANGTVQSVEVLQSTGHRELDEACIAAYTQWHFRQSFAAKFHKIKIPMTFKI